MTQIRATFLATAFLTAMAPGVWAEGSPIPKSGDTFTQYAVVGEWTVFSDSETGTCLVERTDDAGNAMQMGLTKDREFGYLGVFTQGEIPDRGSDEIAVAVDGSIFTGTSQRLTSKKLAGGYNGGYFLTNNPNFVKAVEDGQKLVAFPDSPVAFIIDLTGTKAAIASARECNAKISG